MGWIRHHAIIVTTWGDEMERLKAVADGCFGPDYCVVAPGRTNDYLTLLVPPDGSKEGWQTSDEGDKARDRFVEWLEKEIAENDGGCYSWVEVQYAETEPAITREGGNHS